LCEIYTAFLIHCPNENMRMRHLRHTAELRQVLEHHHLLILIAKRNELTRMGNALLLV
jgi:hypothetical protein